LQRAAGLFAQAYQVREVLPDDPPRDPAAPRDPDQPDPDCPYCHGYGRLRRNLPRSDPEFGRWIACACYAQALYRKKLTRLSGQAGLPPGEFSAVTFESYLRVPKADLYALAEVTNWAEVGRSFSLYLWGPTGRGKTGLAISALRKRIELRGDAVLYRYVPDFYQELRRAFDAGSGGLSSDAVFDLVKDTPLVLFDDLGKENPSPWVKETFYRLVNHRWQLNLPTIFTSNTTLDLLHERFDDALESRVAAMCGSWVVEVDGGKDLRPRGTDVPRGDPSLR
jgi:DNA replication protein DnaC